MYIYIYIYVYMYIYIDIDIDIETMCPSGYHHNGFVPTHALHRPKCMSCHKAILTCIICLPSSFTD